MNEKWGILKAAGGESIRVYSCDSWVKSGADPRVSARWFHSVSFRVFRGQIIRVCGESDGSFVGLRMTERGQRLTPLFVGYKPGVCPGRRPANKKARPVRVAPFLCLSSQGYWPAMGLVKTYQGDRCSTHRPSWSGPSSPSASNPGGGSSCHSSWRRVSNLQPQLLY